MTVLVGRRESFNAAHQLCDPDLSDDENRRLFGKCANLHGHNYVLEVVVAGEIDQASGYVLDLKMLSDIIGRQVIRDVDHRNLNTDVPWLKGRVPTAENLAGASGSGCSRSSPTGCCGRSGSGRPTRTGPRSLARPEAPAWEGPEPPGRTVAATGTAGPPARARPGNCGGGTRPRTWACSPARRRAGSSRRGTVIRRPT